MKKINYIVGGLTILLIIIFSSVNPRRQQAPPAYNAAAETTLSGVVQETREFFCAISEEQGLHLVLRTGDGDRLIHVAPARFLRAQGFRFENGDQVKVIGSPVNYQGEDAMLAREITRGNEVLAVRDHQGQPLWKR